MISLVSEMLQVLRKGGHYQPTFGDLSLLPEAGDPQVSLGNLRLLSQLVPQDMYVGPGGVLVQFTSGEQYVATGFAVSGGPRTEALARYASEHDFGDYDELVWVWAALPNDYAGKLPDAPGMPDAPGLVNCTHHG